MLLSESANGMTTAVSSLMGVVSSVMTTIEANPLLMVFMAAGVVFTAIAVVKSLVGRY